MSAVRVERSGPVTTVVLSRPEKRNAVDGPTAQALADAFREFDGTTRPRSRCSTATAGRSAPAPTSTRSAPTGGTG